MSTLLLLFGLTAVLPPGSLTEAQFLSADPTCGKCAVVAASVIDLPLTGKRLTKAKILHLSSHALEEVALDQSGAVVNSESLARAEAVAQATSFGVFDPRDFETIAATTSQAPMTAYVWTSFSLPDDRKEDLVADGTLASQRADAVSRSVSTVNASLASCLAQLGAKVQLPQQGLPLLRVSAPPSILSRLGRCPGASRIALPHPGAPLGYTYISAVNADLTQEVGTRGAGTKVAILEGSLPTSTAELSVGGEFQSPNTTFDHTQLVAGIVGNPFDNGIDPGVEAWFSDFLFLNSEDSGEYGDEMASIAWTTANGLRIFNYSWSFTISGLKQGPSIDDLAHDWFTLQSPYPLFVAAAGNWPSDDQVHYFVQNEAFDGLTVGGSNDEGTASRSDDQWASTSYPSNSPYMSSWGNPYSPSGDRELPELVAPSVYPYAAGITANYAGTSFAAPIVSAIAAQIEVANPGLAYWPEAKRAIIVASASQHVANADTPGFLGLPNVDFRAGFGEADSYFAWDLALNGTVTGPGNSPVSSLVDYGTIRYPSSFGPNDTLAAGEYNVSTNIFCGSQSVWVRAVLAWDATPSCPTTSTPDGTVPAYSCSGESLNGDLDLCAYDDNGYLIACSASFDNSYEAIDGPFPSAGNIHFEVSYRPNNYPASQTWYGFAAMEYCR